MPHVATGRTVIARILIAAAAAAAACPAGAVLYKWVDEKGVTHYSEQPPSDRSSTRLKVPDAPPAQGGAKPENFKQKELEMRRQRIEKEQAEEREKASADQGDAARRQLCIRARRQLDVLGAGRPLYHVDEHGQRIYMEDAEREAERKKWTKEAEAQCD